MVIEYEKTPELIDWMLETVEAQDMSFEIYKDGKPFVRMVPVGTEDDVAVTDR